ncbi:hypothetical protein PHLGIDRAFT_34702 [Phlebiopsis gigantea 11061_1 CR5-6]|uniref:Uncharacterized protein n=1 Tax=Phlebiopsis gigantea (strain 11061_1 CR5-6) TaxID=745531 RepID=A0A0C3NUC7_PHLG1|nr:hypothetical protein PHLGIDRAFT_34702 [Phlebiopsis gigantea 11061_1 CR5-6]
MNSEPTPVHSSLPGYAPPSIPQYGDEKGSVPLLPGQAAVYPGYNTMQQYYPADIVPQHRSRARMLFARAVHALMLLVVVALLIPALVRGVGHVSRAIGWSHDFSAEALLVPQECTRVAQWVSRDAVPHFEWPNSIIEGGNYDHHYAVQASVNLPVDSDVLYFISKGSMSHGLLNIADDGNVDAKSIKVDITFVYDHEEDLDLAKVCLLQPEEGHNGVGIFTPPRHPHRRHHSHGPAFIVQVHLPVSSSSLLKISDFRTDMPLFFHTVSDLSNSVYFKSLLLHTSNTGIKAESIAADVANLKTSNSVIFGNFSVHDSLQLESHNAPIVANVTLFNSGEGQVTEVSMQTSNGYIHSNVSLVAETKGNTGGKFNVVARSSNSPVDVKFDAAPIDSVLHVDVHTSNSPARLTLDPTYEGSFSLHTGAWFPTTVQQLNEDEEDPAGKDRKRILELRTIRRGSTEGSVAWTPSEREELGTAVLTSSNSPVALYL